MHTFIRTVETDTAADLVWAYLADFTTINEWDPRASRTRRVEGDGGVGSSFETQVRFLGRTVPMRYEITRLEPYRRIEWRGSSSFVRAEDVIDVWSRDGRTVVDYTSSYEYQRAPRLMDRLMARPLDRLGDEARAGLDRTLAAG